MNIKPFLTLFMAAILAANISCAFHPEPYQEKGKMVIFIGFSPEDAARKTYTPEFDVYTFEKIAIKIAKEEIKWEWQWDDDEEEEV